MSCGEQSTSAPAPLQAAFNADTTSVQRPDILCAKVGGAGKEGPGQSRFACLSHEFVTKRKRGRGRLN